VDEKDFQAVVEGKTTVLPFIEFVLFWQVESGERGKEPEKTEKKRVNLAHDGLNWFKKGCYDLLTGVKG
jgi:hypothetical protein